MGKKKKKKSNLSLINIGTLIVSIIALVVSYLSFQTSQNALEYQSNKDSFQNTPAITETLDSTYVNFGLNNDSELQLLNIVFPSKLEENDILLNTKPIRIRKDVLHQIAEKYLQENLTKKDSVIYVGTFSIPVMINYSAIVFGQQSNLRENRLLVYDFYNGYSEFKADFKNSFLISRYGYPIKGHYFLYNPFNDNRAEIIEKQDQEDIDELLNSQFQNIIENLKVK